LCPTPFVGHQIAFRNGGPQARRHRAVEEHLVAAGIGLESIVTPSVCHQLGNVEHIDRMIMAAEARRNAALRAPTRLDQDCTLPLSAGSLRAGRRRARAGAAYVE
jgi:hypothetical protein